MPSNSTLTATIAYEGSKRARVSDLTVELIPLTVALNGTAITSYTVTVTDYWGQPVTWAAPGSAGSAYGVMVGPGTAHELAAGSYRVWVHYDGDPEDITRQADGWVEIFGTSGEVTAELAATSAYQLRAERGQPGGYATLGIDSLVPDAQLPTTLVRDTGAETIAGVKTFSSSPVVPTPTTDGQAANKTYVDNTTAAGAPDATTGGKGIVQLAGDLAGTATAPTVPGLAGKASSSHTHAEADVTSLVSDLAGKAATAHTHVGSDIASGTVAYARLPVGTGLNTVAAGDDSRITGAAADSAVVHNTGAETVAGVKTFSSAPVVPSGSFPESAVTSLVSDLAGKATASHTHAEADVTSLVSDLAAKAPLASPALTGTPTAPTASGGTNTTQVATTAFVIANAGSTPDADASTKGKVQLAGDLGGTAASPTVTGLSGKAPLASPTFTGTPAAPTAAAGTNTTQVATTAYVVAERTATATLTGKTISGASNTLSSIPESAVNLGVWTVTDHGFYGWAYDPSHVAAAGVSLGTNGTLRGVKFKIPAACTVTNIHLWIPALGTAASMSNCYAALYDGTGALLRQSADVSVKWATGGAGAAVGLQTIAITSIAVSAGFFYIGWWGTSSSTQPTFGAINGSASGNANLSAANSRYFTADASLTTTAPSTLGTKTAIAAPHWVAVS